MRRRLLGWVRAGQACRRQHPRPPADAVLHDVQPHPPWRQATCRWQPCVWSPYILGLCVSSLSHCSRSLAMGFVCDALGVCTHQRLSCSIVMPGCPCQSACARVLRWTRSRRNEHASRASCRGRHRCSARRYAAATTFGAHGEMGVRHTSVARPGVHSWLGWPS